MKDDDEQAEVLSHTSRRGKTYYLHEGKTRTGRARYFGAKRIGPGALAAMPAGFEFAESLNGVVTIRRADRCRSSIPEEDLAAVSAALARHTHLHRHRVEARGTEIVIHEMLGRRYKPEMRFVRNETDRYMTYRMSYRGSGGWLRLSSGALPELIEAYVRHLGTDELFELL